MRALLRCCPRRGCRWRQLIAFAPFGGSQVDSAENHGQRGGIDLGGWLLLLAERHLETPRSRRFGPDRKTISIPTQDLAAVALTIEEHEVIAGEDIHAEGMSHHRCQAIKLLAHIGGRRTHEDADGRRQAKHLAPPAERARCVRPRFAGQAPKPPDCGPASE